MVWDLLGSYLGALFYALVVFNVISLSLSALSRYKMKRLKNITISLCVSVIITFFLAELIYSWNQVFFYHLPMLLLVFLYDYRKAVYQKCPECAERIKADALKCKHCHSVIRQTA
jgi:phosphatidylserine synthase